MGNVCCKCKCIEERQFRKQYQLFLKAFEEREQKLQGYVKEIEEVAGSLEEIQKDIDNKVAQGAKAQAIGGVLAVAGIALSPFTGGISLAVGAAGKALDAVGAATGNAANANVTRYKKEEKRVNKLLENYKITMEECYNNFKDREKAAKRLNRKSVRYTQSNNGESLTYENKFPELNESAVEYRESGGDLSSAKRLAEALHSTGEVYSRYQMQMSLGNSIPEVVLEIRDRVAILKDELNNYRNLCNEMHCRKQPSRSQACREESSQGSVQQADSDSD
ncbi:uncharacterized protein LOC114662287 [Erpetoichthys calabaricus]|uniref:uncharacterized protein LOC114662287 n=1 Tax=Erpetoichthys calabaricus TaxID=27687 RepID=UPI00109F4C87|nr:uncharacterized protein LOC114662287 [Erpetoichthys calabaricus]